ncbi:unnamed protein product [Protopolystoma xenopodis]|uniref:Uncharacterized protein n=1 Tax=Protopolystoma xenopodis TaxID=117903 RepID=A0A448X042_9PLAT|nr:unnamed protein product [Protopolystoma xenopodis]
METAEAPGPETDRPADLAAHRHRLLSNALSSSIYPTATKTVLAVTTIPTSTSANIVSRTILGSPEISMKGQITREVDIDAACTRQIGESSDSKYSISLASSLAQVTDTDEKSASSHYMISKGWEE